MRNGANDGALNVVQFYGPICMGTETENWKRDI